MDIEMNEYFILYRLPDDNLEYLNLEDLNMGKEEADFLQIGDVFSIPGGTNVTFVFSGTEEEAHARKIRMLGEVSNSDENDATNSNENEEVSTYASIHNINSELQMLGQRVNRLESRRNSRPSRLAIIEGAVVKINGRSMNVAELSRGDIDNLLAINRQRLGPFPTLPGITDLQITEELGPHLVNAFINMKLGNFVSYLAGFLIEENAFRVSFLSPLGPHLRASNPKPPKRTLNNNFKTVFKYFALYYGGCILIPEFKPFWLDGLRSRFNQKADNLKNKENAQYPTFAGLVPPFNDENAF
uniref:Uncharacterized protein n=1 Tax=Panagrolaimus davidi TaxID=227884 RepID=A0A914QS75_9BILA